MSCAPGMPIKARRRAPQPAAWN